MSLDDGDDDDLNSPSENDNEQQNKNDNHNEEEEEDGNGGSNNNNGSNNNSDSMVSFEEDEEGGESLEELAADGGQPPANVPETLNNNDRPSMVRLRSNDSDNGENLSRHISWRDVYEYDSNNEEKIYEDLCYITFSSTLPEVVDLISLN